MARTTCRPLALRREQFRRISAGPLNAAAFMASGSSRPHSSELFEHTIRQLSRRLRGLRSPEQFVEAMQWAMAELDRAYAESPARVRASVACRSGCGFCCYVPVDVQAHEVFFAAQHIVAHFAPDAVTRLVEQLATHRARLAAFAPGERDRSRHACVLLRDGACSIYAGRPAACRAHHTSDASACASHQQDPNVDIAKSYIPALRARMFAVMLGVDEAIEAAGYDERAYDFGAALHEALTRPASFDAWLRQEPAFPGSCLADPAE